MVRNMIVAAMIAAGITLGLTGLVESSGATALFFLPSAIAAIFQASEIDWENMAHNSWAVKVVLFVLFTMMNLALVRLVVGVLSLS